MSDQPNQEFVKLSYIGPREDEFGVRGAQTLVQYVVIPGEALEVDARDAIVMIESEPENWQADGPMDYQRTSYPHTGGVIADGIMGAGRGTHNFNIGGSLYDSEASAKSAATIAELRLTAKSLGVNTRGLNTAQEIQDAIDAAQGKTESQQAREDGGSFEG